MANQFESYSDADWELFANRLSMLVEEFDVFRNVASNLAALEGWHERNIRSLEENKVEVQRVTQSAQGSFGFFRKISREDRLADLHKNDQQLTASVGIGNELLALVYQVIAHREIALLKSLKKIRFDKLVYEFAQSRIQELEKELLLWKTIELPDEAPEDVHEDKIGRHDFRFTELPRTREEPRAE